MAVYIDIHKKQGDFSLNISFSSLSKRIGILGASGCGKSMTLKCIAGIETPDRGVIRLDDRTLFDSDRRINPKPQKRKVGSLFQNYALFPTMSVRDNIGAGIRLGKEEKNRIIDQMLEKFQLQGLDERLPMELSGGQQQRVALARIMAYEPDVILLDEPFSALDVHLKDRLAHELSEMLEEYRGTVIMVSHSRDEIYRFSEELLVIDQGQSVCFGKTRDVFEKPVRKEAAIITGCKNVVAAIRKDEHSLYIPDWDITIFPKGEPGQETGWVGIRAHDFIPIWDSPPPNSIPIRSYRMDELPFEKKYFIRTNDHHKDEICWYVQRDSLIELEKKGVPSCLLIPEDKILLLS